MKQNKSIFRKTFEPVLAILLLLLLLYTVIIHQDVLKYLKQNAFDVLREQTVNCRDYMEGKMVGQWSAIYDRAAYITRLAEEIVQNEGKTLDSIKTDADLNQKILMEVTDETIDLLKTTDNTEAFVMLDGAGVLNDYDEKNRAGIYIRNTTPGIYLESNGSLLFERGLPAISKEYQIPLDSFWRATFVCDESDSFIYNPIRAARESSNKDFENFGYWYYGCPLDASDKNLLIHSIPMIGRDGTVFGVLGVGVDENYYIKNVQANTQEKSSTKAYMLVRTNDGQGFEPLLIKGKSYSKTDFVGRKLSMTENENGQVLNYIDAGGGTICVNWQKLSLYNTNTPFENEVWGIMGIQRERELLGSYYMAQRLLVILLIVGLVVCSVCVFWFSRFISRPIQGLVKELRQSKPNRPIQLTSVQIVEVDELAEAIETLSAKVAAVYSKISTILQMTDVGISVFEYKEKENLLFCNEEFYEMMGWHAEEICNEYVDGTSFRERMQNCLMKEDGQCEQMLNTVCSDGSQKWIKMTQIREGDTYLGVLTDITTEVLEKQKIERERDRDSLTGLLNRKAFENRVETIFQNDRTAKKAVMMVWDLDNLKYVNDAYGHNVGDQYIKAFAEALHSLDGPQIFSARRSGDEFVTLIYGYEDEKELQKAVDSVWNTISPAEIRLPSGRHYKIRVSMGKAWYPRDAEDYQSMFEYADFAMYMVKHSRKGTMADFDHRSYKESSILLRGQEAFDQLLEKHLVRYMMQPIVRATDGSVYGYEMLMRSDIEVFRSPMDILRLAHSQSRLYEIEIMTWFEAMKCFVTKAEAGECSPDSKVFINSTANQVLSDEMFRLFEEMYGKYLSNIVCEFTEEEESNHQMTQQKLEYVRRWNAKAAIDDYGCGYNSEMILLKLSPDIVKIDLSIIRGISRDIDRQQLVSNLVRYARGRNILVLAEGVEDREELETLIRLGVDLLQGYYIARPSYEVPEPVRSVCREIREMNTI